MRQLALLVAVAALLSAEVARAAQSGCAATVELSSLPKAGHQAGQPWLVTVRVLQHGIRPLAGAKPEIRIQKTGRLTTFRGRPTATVGSYRFRVVFPAAGRWTVTVFDGFVPNCARVHTFKPVTIVPADLAP
ncbi:MAG: FixH family protein [Gaiellaceae bacterium MAG52_C11]|nr:FixH family protein [Candidatus Gaiellasilicea maunaloa]